MSWTHKYTKGLEVYIYMAVVYIYIYTYILLFGCSMANFGLLSKEQSHLVNVKSLYFVCFTLRSLGALTHYGTLQIYIYVINNFDNYIYI